MDTGEEKKLLLSLVDIFDKGMHFVNSPHSFESIIKAKNLLATMLNKTLTTVGDQNVFSRTSRDYLLSVPFLHAAVFYQGLLNEKASSHKIFVENNPLVRLDRRNKKILVKEKGGFNFPSIAREVLASYNIDIPTGYAINKKAEVNRYEPPVIIDDVMRYIFKRLDETIVVLDSKEHYLIQETIANSNSLLTLLITVWYAINKQEAFLNSNMNKFMAYHGEASLLAFINRHDTMNLVENTIVLLNRLIINLASNYDDWDLDDRSTRNAKDNILNKIQVILGSLMSAYGEVKALRMLNLTPLTVDCEYYDSSMKAYTHWNRVLFKSLIKENFDKEALNIITGLQLLKRCKFHQLFDSNFCNGYVQKMFCEPFSYIEQLGSEEKTTNFLDKDSLLKNLL